MTYGWAILAIAIVMVSLYSLGIFNTGSLQPTATPGSCEVVRTAAQTSLAGQCTNMIPKYVAQFNGQTSGVSTPVGTKGADTYTFTAWINAREYAPNPGGRCYNNASIIDDDYGGYADGYGVSASDVVISYPDGCGLMPISTIATDTWYFTAVEFLPSSNKVIAYVDNEEVTASVSFNVGQVQTHGELIGGAGMYSTGPYGTFNGSIADVQVYNTSLDSASIQELYGEGIGGVPVDIDHLIAWWPLNGNANDYSGNNNQGNVTDVAWNANWQSGYAAPAT